MKLQIGNLQDTLTALLRDSGYKRIVFNSFPIQISRNTILQLGTADAIKFIAKISQNSIGEVGLGERQAYSELSMLIGDEDFFSVPKVLTGNENWGIVILEYVDGITFEQKLISSIRSGSSECIFRDFLLLGSLLSHYHKKYNKNGGNIVRLYVDYSPKNILIREFDNRLFLIDLPGRKALGIPEIDIGKGLFEVSRVFVKSKSLKAFKSFEESRLAYLQGYWISSRPHEERLSLNAIHKEEAKCFSAAISNYLKFYRFNDYIYQFFRGMCMILILSFLRIVVLYFSYKEKKHVRW